MLRPSVIAAAALVALAASGAPLFASPGSIVFATSADSPLQARKAALLIDSIREFAGPFSRAPIFAVIPDGLAEETAGLWNGRNVTVLRPRVSGSALFYPYALKVFAAAQVEELVARTAEVMIWLDPETLVLRPPTTLALRRAQAAALRPVFLANAVGIPYEKNADPFWNGIHAVTGASPEVRQKVMTLVDETPLAFYVNCGVYSVRPGKGICKRWADAFTRLITDARFQREAVQDSLHRFFLHQAVFSSVLLAATEPGEWKWLPENTGYPVHLHERVPLRQRLRSLDEAVVAIHENTLESRAAFRDAIPVSESLSIWLEQSWDRLHRISDTIWREAGSCNSYLVKTSSGSVVIDPAGARSGGFLKRLAARWPVEAILLTHGHDDHRLGIAAMKGDRDIPVVAQRGIVEDLAYRERLSGFFASRDAAQFGGRAGPPRPPAPLEATLLFDSEHTVSAGGVSFRMTRVGGETADTSLIHVPEFSAVFIADDFYGSFPMLAPPRGSRPRWALEYIDALERALKLEPEFLLPGHGDPVTGKAEVQRRLTAYRDAIRHVHDAVVKGMNEGKDVFTLAREIRLPEGSGIGEYYGKVSWAVRGIHAAYGGWFDGDPANLFSRPPAIGELVSLAGEDAISARAAGLLEQDAVTALQLASAVLESNPRSEKAIEIRLKALQKLLDESKNLAERNWLAAAIRQAKENQIHP